MTAPAPSSPPTKTLTCAEIALAQNGVIGRQQALKAGMTPDQWRWKTAHHWTSIGEGVAVTHSGEPTYNQKRWAALVHAGEDAALDGDIALQTHGVKRLHLVRYDISVPPKRQVEPVSVDGFFLVPHRTQRTTLWTSKTHGLPTIRIDLATLHAAAWAPSDREAELRLCLVVQQGKTKPSALRSVLQKQTRLRRRALILEALDDIELGAHANSEIDFLRFCRRNGIPRPDQLQVLVRADGKRYLDARWSWLNLSVEIDGAHHMWVEEWDADALRSLEVAIALRGTGETLIRLTQGNLRHSEEKVAELLRQLFV